MDKELQNLANTLEEELDLDNIELPEEYNYTCLPLCLLDAVFSIGVTYKSTQNVVERYCKKCNIKRYKWENGGREYPHTISDLIGKIEEVGTESFASCTVENMQRTSSTNGILKAQAVLECAKIFHENGIETISSFQNKSDSVKCDFMGVTGQGSGISFEYLCMLCGDESKIKPDRHIIRFLQEHYPNQVTEVNAEEILQKVLNLLRPRHENLTLRKLDYVIWKHQSEAGTSKDYNSCQWCKTN